MKNIQQIIEQLDTSSQVSFKELLKICRQFFGEPRIKGSHHIFKMPWQGNPRINLQMDGNEAKMYQVKQVIEALKKRKENENAT